MKKIYFALIAGLIYPAVSVLAQLNYNNSLAENKSGPYVDLGSNGSAISTANKDNANSTAQNIGFTFKYNGQNFTQFILNTNGFIKLGSTAPSSTSLFFSRSL